MPAGFHAVFVFDFVLQTVSSSSQTATSPLSAVHIPVSYCSTYSLSKISSIFFQIKASDDFRAIRRTPPHKPTLRTSKIKRVSRVRWYFMAKNISITFKQDLRKIERALGGRHDAFTHILNLAYGRKGKLKWELMEVLSESYSFYLCYWRFLSL